MPEELNNADLRSEDVQEILTAIPNWMIRWGNTLILVLLIMLLTLSWVVKYPDIITTETSITSQSPPQKEYARIAGKIDTLFVVDHQRVSQNALLAVIENSANVADVFALKAAVDTIDLQQETIRFPMSECSLLSLGELSMPYALFEKDYLNYTLNKTFDLHTTQNRSHQLSIDGIRYRLKNLEAQKQIDLEKSIIKQKEFQRSQQLFLDGIISASDFERKQLDQLEEEKRIKNLDISISQLR